MNNDSRDEIGPIDDLIDRHLIASLPPSMYYIPNFITPEEERFLLNQIPPNRWVALSHRRLQAIPARLTAANALVTSSPRLGSENAASSGPLPSWLRDPVVARIQATLPSLFASAPHGINHCLVNEYLPGQGIMPHEDGPAYFPVVATVSLAAGIVLEVTGKDRGGAATDSGGLVDEGGSSEEGGAGVMMVGKTKRIFQERRSLLVTSGLAYTDTLHGIRETEVDCDMGEGTVANWGLLSDEGREMIAEAGGRMERKETRVSLTLRDVLKVIEVGGKVFGKRRG